MVIVQIQQLIIHVITIDGVWHTAIVVHGVEWFYGGGGIENVSPPGTTMLGSPLK